MILRNPLPGAAVDAGGGALTDIGISNDMVEGFAESFESDCSALFMLVRKAMGDKVLARFSELTGTGKVLQALLIKDKRRGTACDNRGRGHRIGKSQASIDGGEPCGAWVSTQQEMNLER